MLITNNHSTTSHKSGGSYQRLLYTFNIINIKNPNTTGNGGGTSPAPCGPF